MQSSPPSSYFVFLIYLFVAYLMILSLSQIIDRRMEGCFDNDEMERM
jgi:hypothetical protein